MLSTWAAWEPAVGHVHAHLHDVISGRPVQRARGEGAGQAWENTPCPLHVRTVGMHHHCALERLTRAVMEARPSRCAASWVGRKHTPWSLPWCPENVGRGCGHTLGCPSGSAYVVEGTATLWVDDPEQACGDAALLSAFRSAQASIASVEPEAIETSCSVVQRRRLAGNGRRLAGSIEFAYKISLSSAESAEKLVSDIDAKSLQDLTTLIVDNLPDGAGYKVEVVGKGTPTLTVVTITTTTTGTLEDGLPAVSHARVPVVSGSLAVAALSTAVAFLLQ